MSPSRKLPLRAAILGLSASSTTSWAAQGHLPFLLSDDGRKYYTIVALSNSSVDAAQEAIRYYNLSSTTKAYGNAEDLAGDPDVDIVICNTRVDKHYETIMPSIKAGKDIYIEWPVAANSKDTNRIVQAAIENEVRVAVGLQGRWSPPVIKLRDILRQENTGKVLSSEVHVSGAAAPGRDILGTGWEYFADMKLGGNHVTVLFGHLIDQVQWLLGNTVRGSTTAYSQIQWPKIRVIDQTKNEVIGEIDSDVPDLFFITGTLSESTLVAPSATVHGSYHRVWPYPNEPTITWTITCENADIRLRVYDYPSLQADAYGKPVLIDIRRPESDEVEPVEWQWPDESLPVRSRNTAHCLRAFARGDDENWADLRSAAVVMEQLEAWLALKRW